MLRDVLENIKAAIRSGRTDIVKNLIVATENRDFLGLQDEEIPTQNFINSTLTEEGTFLHLATSLSQADIVRMLLAAGADPGIQNEQGLTAMELASGDSMQAVYTEELLKATAQANVGRVCQLVAAGISINSPDSPSNCNTALHWAATYANRDMVQCLLDRGAKVNAVNACGATPLHDAVHRKVLDIVAELLHHGANPLIRAVKGKFAEKTPLDLAVDAPQLLSLLVDYSAGFMNGNVPETEMSSEKKSSSLESLVSAVQEHGITSVTRRLSLLSTSAKDDVVETHHHQINHVRSLSDSLSNRQGRESPAGVETDKKLHLLWPQPQRIEQLDGPGFKVRQFVPVYIVVGPDQTATATVVQAFDMCKEDDVFGGVEHSVEGVLVSAANVVDRSMTCHVNPNLFATSNSYKITIRKNRVNIVASDITGLNYSLITYAQLLDLYKDETAIPQLQISDWPSLSHRGVMLDLSPNSRVPNLETLLFTVKLLASLKVNHIHFYTRFSAKDNWEVSYQHRELIELNRHCRKLHVSLVPAIDVDHHVAFEELSDLFGPLQTFLACFSNTRYIHFGPHLTNLVIDANSGEPPLEEFYRVLPLPQHLTPMLCCNAFHSDPEVLKQLPPNVILLEYGFQASYNFLDVCQNLSHAGASFCVVPGTACWNSVVGSPEAALCNVDRASQTADQLRAFGMIAADWSGNGIVPSHIFSWPGFLISAGFSWNSSTHKDYVQDYLADLLNHHVFQDKGEAMGKIIVKMGNSETFLVRSSRAQSLSDISDLPPTDGTPLHQLLTQPDDLNLEHLTVDTFYQMVKHAKNCQTNLQKADLKCSQASDVLAEIHLAIDLIVLASKLGRALVNVGRNPNSHMGVAVVNLGVSNLAPTTRTDCANRLLGLTEQYSSVWLRRNQSCGLQNVLNCLNTILKQMIPET